MSKAIRVYGSDKIIFVPDHIGDIELSMDDFPDVDNSLKYEDKTVIGEWTDYTGSGGMPTSQAIYQGTEAKDPERIRNQAINGDTKYTARGNQSSTQRQRVKKVYYKLDGEEKEIENGQE